MTQDEIPRTVLTVPLDRAELNEWTRLAREKGYSRAVLIRMVLNEVGLHYARSLQPTETGAGYREPAAA